MGIFTTLVYQPFFNLLVGIYWLLDLVTNGNADMGIAVILFTVVFRILWLPITFSSSRSAKERHDISVKIKEIKKEYAKEPLKEESEMKKIMRGNRRIVTMSTFNIVFQLMVMLMLYRIFTSGLDGADFHLIYEWMPEMPQQFNLTFLGKFDLTRPNWTLNLIQSIIILIVEGLSGILSPFPTGRTELMALFVLPIGAFTFFAYMPAGKKLFVITTLLFTMMLQLVKGVRIIYYKFKGNARKLAYGMIINKDKK